MGLGDSNIHIETAVLSTNQQTKAVLKAINVDLVWGVSEWRRGGVYQGALLVRTS
jgi:hypothetical protein